MDEATHEAFLRVQEQLPEIILLCMGEAFRGMASTAGDSVGIMMVVVASSSGRGQSFDEGQEVLQGGKHSRAHGISTSTNCAARLTRTVPKLTHLGGHVEWMMPVPSGSLTAADLTRLDLSAAGSQLRSDRASLDYLADLHLHLEVGLLASSCHPACLRAVSLCCRGFA